MSISGELPEKCQVCVKSAQTIIHKNCSFCLDIDFCESILCQLNQCIQDQQDFKCFAFQPLLKLVTPSGKRVPDSYHGPEGPFKGEPFRRCLDSDKIKYERALALQKLNRDPDDVFMDIKYHFAWNVIHRRSVFGPTDYTSNFVHNIFLRCSELVGGVVNLLALAPDHVHLYVESDGERSVETMILEIKRFSNGAILANSEIKERLSGMTEIWDPAYFAQTVG